MKMLRLVAKGTTVLGLCFFLSGFSTPENVECIAPSPPGGGWDFTCRSVGRLLHELGHVTNTIRVNNVPGAAGAVAFSHVIANRSEDPNLLVATSAISGFQLAQGKYAAGVDAVRWLAVVGADVGVVMVNKDSKLKTLADLIATLKADPASISNGAGIYDHLRLLSVAKKGGIGDADLKKIRMVHYDGCGESIPAVLGGHVDVTTCDLGEVKGFVESGDVRVLAVLGDERPAAPFDMLPTAKEQGIDVVGYNWRGFYVGGGVSDDVYNGWLEIIKKVYDSPEWQTILKEHGLMPLWIGGADFDTFFRKSVEDMRELSKTVGVNQ